MFPYKVSLYENVCLKVNISGESILFSRKLEILIILDARWLWQPIHFTRTNGDIVNVSSEPYAVSTFERVVAIWMQLPGEAFPRRPTKSAGSNKTLRFSARSHKSNMYYSFVSLRFNKSPPHLFWSSFLHRHAHIFPPHRSYFKGWILNSRRCGVTRKQYQVAFVQRFVVLRAVIVRGIILKFSRVCGTHRRQRDGHINCPFTPPPSPFSRL